MFTYMQLFFNFFYSYLLTTSDSSHKCNFWLNNNIFITNEGFYFRVERNNHWLMETIRNTKLSGVTFIMESKKK